MAGGVRIRGYPGQQRPAYGARRYSNRYTTIDRPKADTATAETFEVGDDLVALQVRVDADRVDGGVGGVGETGDVRGRDAGADVHVQHVVTLVHQHPQRVHAYRARLVLHGNSSAGNSSDVFCCILTANNRTLWIG